MPSFRIVLKDEDVQRAQEAEGFVKPISYFAANVRSARADAKKDAIAKGCRVEIHVTSERLLEAYERCEQCEGSGKMCGVCSKSKNRCTCAVFYPVVCLNCSGEGLTTSTE